MLATITYLTPWGRALLEKLIVAQIIKKFAFHETRMFIAVFTRARHRILSQPVDPIHILTSYLFKMRFTIIRPSLSFMLSYHAYYMSHPSYPP
jgi:hypothetical protein